MDGDIVKFTHLGSIFIPRVKGVDEVNVVHQLITIIELLHHAFYFLIHDLLCIITLMCVVMLDHIGVSREFKWINVWEIGTVGDLLTSGDYILFLVFNFLRLIIGLT